MQALARTIQRQPRKDGMPQQTVAPNQRRHARGEGVTDKRCLPDASVYSTGCRPRAPISRPAASLNNAG